MHNFAVIHNIIIQPAPIDCLKNALSVSYIQCRRGWGNHSNRKFMCHQRLTFVLFVYQTLLVPSTMWAISWLYILTGFCGRFHTRILCKHSSQRGRAITFKCRLCTWMENVQNGKQHHLGFTWNHELTQKEKDDKTYVVTLSIMQYKNCCWPDWQTKTTLSYHHFFPLFAEFLVTSFFLACHSSLYMPSLFV